MRRKKKISVKEVTSLDVIFANEFLNKVELKKFDFAYRKIEKIFYGINIQQMKKNL